MTRPAAHVGHARRRRWQEALNEETLGPMRSAGEGPQAFVLPAGVVIAADRFVEVGHVRSVRAARLPRQVVR